MLSPGSSAAARRSVWVIIFGMWMVALGAYLVIPFFTIYLRETLGLSAVQIGLALTAKLWASYGLTMVGGALSDRYGAKMTMTAGLLIRAFSYIGIATAGSATSVILWSMLMGVGGALFNPASKTAMATLAPSGDRVRLFSIRYTANNLGVAIGPLVGMVAVFGNPASLFYVAAMAYALFALMTALLVTPAEGEHAAASRPFSWRIMTWLAFDIRMIYLECIIAFFMFLYMQMELTMPMHAKAMFGDWGVSLLFVANAMTVVGLQVPLSGVLAKRLPASVTIALGMVGMALGLLLMSLSTNLPTFLAAIVLFTLGEITIDPRVDAETSDMVPPGTVGTALGILGAMNALGGTLGNMVGGPVYTKAAEAGAGAAFWTWLGIAAIVGAMLVLLVGSLLEVPVEEES